MKLSKEDRKRIQESIKQKYAKVSTDPSGQFRYPTGRAGLEALAYDRETIEALSDSVVDAFCGVGNPFALGPIKTGERVLDIGCGAGVDAFIAASMVRAEGKVAGIDMVPEMIERAKQNLLETTLKNVSFQQASAENLPFPNDSFDVALSNGVFNLIPDKVKALSEVFRVLRPGGRMMLADQILSAPITGDKSERIESWFR